jgi:hypothetical protein
MIRLSIPTFQTIPSGDVFGNEVADGQNKSLFDTTCRRRYARIRPLL